MTCNNIFKSLNTVKSSSFFFKERSEGKSFKNNSLHVEFFLLIHSYIQNFCVRNKVNSEATLLARLLPY